jgi:zinc/manganese transport system substrate-binding protein
MNYKKILVLVLSFLALSFYHNPHAWAAKKIRIVTTTTVFGDIASQISGNQAEIYSIASPNRDIHFIAPTPRDVLKIKKADVLINAGLDLEAWRGPLLDAAGRMDLMWPNGERQIDVSKSIQLLEAPSSLSRSQGDIHAYGNPHYWPDPENGKIIARNIADGLSRLYPEDAGTFEKNYTAFTAKIDEHMKQWQVEMAPYKGQAVVSYHKSLIYFTRRFGLIDAGELEPNPGIPPTAKHLADLERMMREDNVKIILKETFYENRTAEKVAKETGAVIVMFAQAVGEVKEAKDYISMIDYDVRAVAEGFKKAEASNE